ncbi:MAG: Fe-S cluster assembly protein HesB [Actinomycetota bacterium]|nr:Fe-S cluster assembly protein HesB [Actinomycetota bacterium]
MNALHLSQDPDADALLGEDPLALVMGMLLDQQIPMEKAFRGPYDLKRRLGRDLDAADIAGRNDLAELFATPPAIHRFPGSMAGRVQDLCRHLIAHHGGRADNVWHGVESGDELLGRLKALPGFGEQKAKIFLALLGKQCGVTPEGWREAAGAYGEVGSMRSVADVTSPDTLLRVRASKQEMKKAAKAQV